MTSHSSSTHLLRSVSDIITSLKNSPRSDANFKQAELELLAKENYARGNYDALEEKCSSLTLQVLHLEGENCKLTRECEIKEDKASDLAELVDAMVERGDKSSKRYQRAKYDIEVLERKKDELCRELEKVRSSLMERVGVLEDDVESLRRVLSENNEKLCEKDEEIVVLTRKVDVLEEEKRKNEAKLEGLMKMCKEMGKVMETIQKQAADQCVTLGKICEDYRSDKAFLEDCLGMMEKRREN